MEKLKKSLFGKLLASLIFAVSLIVGFGSFIMIIRFYEDDVYNPGGKERARQSVIDSIVWNYNHTALEYYGRVAQKTLNSDNTEDFDYFENYFSEENTNYFFTIEPREECDKEIFPVLINYESDEYQYKNIYYEAIAVYPATEKFVFSLAGYDVIDDDGPIEYEYIEGQKYFYIPEDFTDGEYLPTDVSSYELLENSNHELEIDKDEETEAVAVTEMSDSVTEAESSYAYEYDTTEAAEFYDNYVYMETTDDGNYSVYISENGYHYIVNDSNGTTLCLENNQDFVYAFANFESRMDEKFTWYDSYAYYNPTTMEYVIEVNGSKYIEVKITSGVKADLTANDAFYSSFWIKNIATIVDVSLPAFAVSVFLLIITFVYLVMSAGHSKSADGIVLTWFDKIPYDIVLVMFLMTTFIGLYIVGWNINTTSVGNIVVALVLGLMALLMALMLYTTSARIKAKSIFKNTALFRIGKMLLSWVKFFWQNLNIYWKYLGVFVLVTLFEVFLLMAGLDSNMVILLMLFEKVLYGIILAVGLINMNKLKNAASEIASGNTSYEVDTEKMLWEFKKHGENLNSIKDGIQIAVEERMKSERMKTELITNVSHDIKTPLTSIISYVDLLSKEEFDNEKAKEYIEVLDRQSARLKKLIQDLIDASKASTGNMPVEIMELDSRVLLEQALAEYSEKLDKKGLKLVVNSYTDNTLVKADGKLLWRTFDNIVGNIVKYAQDNTRVYIDMEETKIGKEDSMADVETISYYDKRTMLKVSFKNISKDELNISGEELMERFVRGDSSRNTEGSGLGLSIAKSLMEIQNGKLEIIVDGDLFKVVLLIATA